ncbi:MAG: succinate dehydrogenase, cytochrome b556 subunit [Bdellovibrionales bacterium]
MPATKPARPLSPHLGIYRPQLTSVMSILHRATGVGLALGLPVMVAWLMALAAGPSVYDAFVGVFQHPVGQILLFGWSWAFFYHFCTGIRHLLWDAGFMLNLPGVNASGWVALAVSTLVTAADRHKLLGENA